MIDTDIFIFQIYGVSMQQKTTKTEKFWFNVDLQPRSGEIYKLI